MKERFGREYPQGRIGQTAEKQGAEDFGSERLTRERVANCLNLKEGEISGQEWTEISEFAVNAGAAMYHAAATRNFPKHLSTRGLQNRRHKIERNDMEMFPDHDLFHAAELYRRTHGREVVEMFARVDDRSRYIDPQTFASELYPVLFGTFGDATEPIPVLLCSKDGREKFMQFIEKMDWPKEYKENIADMLRGDNARAEDRRRTYEAIVENILVVNAKTRVKNITPMEIKAMREGIETMLKNPPENYARFAPKVFGEEWRTNRRLFLDDLLDCIRTKPEVT